MALRVQMVLKVLKVQMVLKVLQGQQEEEERWALRWPQAQEAARQQR
jgi:hypothetical protein